MAGDGLLVGGRRSAPTAGRTTGGGGRLRGLLVIGEVATAVLLLFGAGLLLRTLMAVEAFDRGYRAESVLTMLVDPLGSSYPTPEIAAAVLRSGRSGGPDGSGRRRTSRGRARCRWRLALRRFALTYEIVGDPPVTESAAADHRLSGRQPDVLLDARPADRRRPRLRRRDTRDSPPVCIVNEAFVAQLSAAGRRSACGSSLQAASTRRRRKPVVGEIVGVAKQVKGRPDEPKDFVQIYVPMAHDLVDDMF